MPTDSEVIEKLARFCYGVEPKPEGETAIGAPHHCFYCGEEDYPAFHVCQKVNFLNSLDALQPVMEKFTQGQLTELIDLMLQIAQESRVMRPDIFSRWLLTIPPRTLALALYEVIGEQK